jgi:hypothetical protein
MVNCTFTMTQQFHYFANKQLVSYCLWLPGTVIASTKLFLDFSILCDVTQRRLVASYRRWVTPQKSEDQTPSRKFIFFYFHKDHIYAKNILHTYLLHDAKMFIFALNTPVCPVYVPSNKYKTRGLIRAGK